jgi:hypothetical protein
MKVEDIIDVGRPTLPARNVEVASDVTDFMVMVLSWLFILIPMFIFNYIFTLIYTDTIISSWWNYRALTQESIGLREITKDHLESLCPNTHASGSEQIDGGWATTDITITAVKWLSYEESPGDHRACVFDFTTLSAIGSHERKIVLPKCRRLISSNPGAVAAYNAEMDRQFKIFIG